MNDARVDDVALEGRSLEHIPRPIKHNIVVDTGVVSAPALGRRWWAMRGEGAFAGNGAHPRVGSGAGRGRRRLDELCAGDARRGWGDYFVAKIGFTTQFMVASPIFL